MAIKDLSPGDRVNFTMYASIAGTNRISGVVNSVSNYTGLPIGNTVNTDHVNLYREVPIENKGSMGAGPEGYLYLVVTQDTGEILACGFPWIIESTLVSNISRKLVIEIADFQDGDDIFVRNILEVKGYKVSSSEIVQS